MKHSLREVKVGDVIVVEQPSYSNGADPVVTREIVTRLARKYLYVGKVKGRYDEIGYEIATGVQKSQDRNYTSYLATAYTPIQWEEEALRRDLLGRIRDHKSVFLDRGWSGPERTWPTARLMELVVLLDGVRDELAKTDLD